MIKFRIEYISKGSGHFEWPDPKTSLTQWLYQIFQHLYLPGTRPLQLARYLMMKFKIEYISKESGHLEWPDPQNFSYTMALPNLPTFIPSRYQATPGGQVPNDEN